MRQSYIRIFENEMGDITLAYAPCGDDMQRAEIGCLAIEKDDLYVIGKALIDLAEGLEEV